MVNRESLISLHLLNTLVEEILRSEVPADDSVGPVRRMVLRQSHAEIIDEKLFRRTLLGMPKDKASQLIRSIEPKFYSRRFSENCFLALEKLAVFEHTV